MKVTVDPHTVVAEEKTDIQLQNEALLQSNRLEEAKVASLYKQEEEKIATAQEAEPTVKDLRMELGGTLDQRMQGTRSLTLTMEYGKKPVVVFSGFWTGKFVMSAQNAIARSYRTTKFKHLGALALKQEG